MPKAANSNTKVFTIAAALGDKPILSKLGAIYSKKDQVLKANRSIAICR